MMNRFQVKVIRDENEYITDVYITDIDKIIGDYHHPVGMDMIQLVQLFDAIKPFVKEYEQWRRKKEKEIY